MLRESLGRILDRYLSAATEPFKDHELARFLRHDFPRALSDLVQDKRRYRVAGSAGQSTWADSPWVAVLDILITSSPQRGFYVAYVFPGDMRGVYLSLQQGITDLRLGSGDRQAKERLNAEAAKCRSQLGSLPPRLRLTTINLATQSPSRRSAFYEAGNVCAIYYDARSIPSEDVLVSDYHLLLSLYERLVEQKNREEASVQVGYEGLPLKKLLDDVTNMKMHQRYERNPQLARKVKRILGYTCQACGFRFGDFYGPLGADYIEAHHLVPRSELRGQIVSLDPGSDFAVLCSNCHSMIHRYDEPHDVEAFRALITP